MEPRRREKTFLVRMWVLDSAHGDAQWRGSVQDIESGKRLFVTHARDVADFISEELTDGRPRDRPA